MMTKDMTISVIVPTYNCAKYIKEAIDSILSQTQPADEIIIVDDGSVDNTKAIIEEFTSKKIKYFLQKNAGVSAARNFGLSVAGGEYVTFLDADDRWRVTMLEEQLKAFEACKDLVFSFTNFIRFAQESEPSQQSSKSSEQEPKHIYLDQFQFYPEIRNIKTKSIDGSISLIDEDSFCALVGFGETPAYTSCMMFSRHKINLLRFNQALKICEDAEFVLRAATQGKVAFNSNILLDMRRHGENATHDISNIAFDKLKALLVLSEYENFNEKQIIYLNDRVVRAYFDAINASLSKRSLRKAMSLCSNVIFVRGPIIRKLKGTVKFLYLTLKYLLIR